MITIDIQQAMSELSMIAARAADMGPILHTIGAMEARKSFDRIRETKVDPLESEWDPWAESTRSQRERKGNAGQGLLWDSGYLLNSFEVNADPMQVVIGTEVEYAGYLQEGTFKMPDRAFMGWNDSDLPIIEGTVAAYLMTGTKQ